MLGIHDSISNRTNLYTLPIQELTIMNVTDLYLESLQFEQTLNEYELLSEGKIQQIVDHVKNRLDLAKTYLAKFGINSKELVAKGSNFITTQAYKYYKQGLTPDKAAKKILSKLISIITPYLKKAVKKFKGMNIKAKFFVSLLLALAAIALVLIFNTVALDLLRQVGFSLWDAFRIGCVIVAPMLEEAMKTLFISIGIPYVGTAIFVGVETIVQGLVFAKDLSKLPSFLMSRILNNIFHFLTVILQKDIEKKSKEEQESTAKRLFKMWLTAFILHSTFNAIVLMRNQEFYRSIFDVASWPWIKNALTGGGVAF